MFAKVKTDVLKTTKTKNVKTDQKTTKKLPKNLNSIENYVPKIPVYTTARDPLLTCLQRWQQTSMVRVDQLTKSPNFDEKKQSWPKVKALVAPQVKCLQKWQRMSPRHRHWSVDLKLSSKFSCCSYCRLSTTFAFFFDWLPDFVLLFTESEPSLAMIESMCLFRL